MSYRKGLGTIEPTATVSASKRPVVALAVICASVGLLSLLLLGPAVDVLTAYRAPAARPERDGKVGEPMTDRVVLVVLSGLGVAELSVPDDPWRQAQLRRRAGEGSFGTARAVQPSADTPTWAALLSGAGPAASGIVQTHETGRLAVTSIFDRLRDTGESSAVVASQVAWNARAGLARPDRLAVVSSSTDVADRAVALLREHAESLVVVLIDMGRVGHLSAETRWSRVDQQFAAVVAALDPTRDTLIVTADHGFLPDGSSGGHEPQLVDVPLVLWGRAIRPVQLKTADQRDVAATTATLLGFPYPPFGGRPLLDALNLSESARAGELVRLLQSRISADRLEHSAARTSAHASLAGALHALDESEWGSAIAAAEAGLAALDRPPSRPRYLTSTWVWGLVAPLALLVAARILARFRNRLHHFRLPATGLVGHFAVWCVIYFGFAGKRLSLSAIYGAWLGALSEIALLSGLAFATVAVAVGVWRAGRGALDAAIGVGWIAALVLLTYAVFIGLFLLLGPPLGQGAYLLASAIRGAPHQLPDLRAWATLLLALAQAAGVGLAAPGAMLLGAMLADVTARGR